MVEENERKMLKIYKYLLCHCLTPFPLMLWKQVVP